MATFGAIWYPGESPDADLNLDPKTLSQISDKLPGTPVTWNHRGIFDAVATNKSFDELGVVSPAKGPVGTVVGAFVDQSGRGRCVFSTTGPLVSAMMSEQVVTGVSLSHAQSCNGVDVLELTLTPDPARKGAVVDAQLGCDDPVSEYIASCANKHKSATMDASPAAVPDPVVDAEMTDCEKAIATLSETDRKIICDRMEEMAGRASAAVARQKELENAVSEYKAKYNTDITVCREALRDFVDSVGTETASRWRVGGLADTKESSFDARDVYNLVCASNEALRQARALNAGAASSRSQPETGTKRTRLGEAAPAAAAAPASNSLRAALASTFEA